MTTPAWASGDRAYREKRVWLHDKAEIVLRCIRMSGRDKPHHHDRDVVINLMTVGFASTDETGALAVTPLGQQWLDKPKGAVH